MWGLWFWLFVLCGCLRISGFLWVGVLMSCGEVGGFVGLLIFGFLAVLVLSWFLVFGDFVV